MRTTICNQCGAEIHFVSVSGKKWPCETEPVDGKDLEENHRGIVTEDGKYLRRPDDFDWGYEPHFVYCNQNQKNSMDTWKKDGLHD